MPRPHPSGPQPGAPHPAGLAQMRALAHPLRLRILELFTDQPRTTMQVAELLEQPPTRLYHHVAALERAGLLRLTETRKKRGTVERWYQTVAHSFESAPRPGARRGKTAASAARRAVALTVLEHARQEVVAAMQRPGEEKPLLGRVVILAPRERIGELKTRLRQMVRDLQREVVGEDGAEPAPKHERWALTLTFTPLLRGRGREQASAGARTASPPRRSRAPGG